MKHRPALALPTFALVMIFSLPATTANLDSLDELSEIPVDEEEASLWVIASKHENNLGNSGRLFHDRHVEAYLESITDQMLGQQLDHLGIEVDFILVEEPTLSAWVYPYGTIAVHTGLLTGMDNEAQLASILAHEISHFLQRHSYRETISKGRQSLLGKGFGILATAAAAKATGVVDTGLIDATGGLWTDLVTNGYSRKLEYVADEEGLDLMANAHYAEDQALIGFAALGDNDVYGVVNINYLWSSHPKLEDRLKNLQKEIKKRKRKKNYVPGVVPEAERYYAGIAPILIMNARLDIKERQYERARMALNKYMSVSPGDPEAEFLVGETLRKQNPDGPDFAERMNAYERALEKDSGYAVAYKELGMAYRMQRANSEALQAFEKYLALAPDAPDAGIIRGYMETL